MTLTQKDLGVTFNQAMNLWINPEIIRRKQKGWIKKDFVLKQALIFLTPGKRPKIRFNEQAYLKGEIETNRKINPGELVYDKDVKKINKITPERLPPNNGWFAIIFLGKHFIIAFNFGYNDRKIKEHIDAAREFYNSAMKNLESKRLRPFFEECWAVAELLSVCNFLRTGFQYDKHRVNIKNMKNWADLGNIKNEFSETLENLSELRKSARYMNSKDFEKENTQKIIDALEEMFEFTEKLIN